MTDNKLIVVGAGHNGLTCAAYAAKEGFDVLVLEAAEQVGGAACTMEFAPGFRVSSGAHVLGNLDPKVAQDLDLASHGLRMAAQDMPMVALAEDGQSHIVLDESGVRSGPVSQRDREGLAEFRRRTARYAALLAKFYARKPIRLAPDDWSELRHAARFALDIRLLGRDDMRDLLRIGGINIYDVLNEDFDSPLLKAAISMDAVLGVRLGPRSNNTVLNYLHRLVGGDGPWAGAVALPAGGMGSVTGALRKAAEAQGARVRTGARVARITHEHGRVNGVQLADGEQLNASIVVSNADPRTTLFELVGAGNFETGFARRVNNIRMQGYAAKLHLALDQLPAFAGLDPALLGGRLMLAPDMQYIERAFDCAKYNQYSASPVMEITVPSVTDSSLVPMGKHVLSAVVQYAPYSLESGWEQGAGAFTQLCVDTLAAYAPELPQHIIASELLSPLDMERRFGMTGGHWHHGEFAFDQFLMLRPVAGAARYAMPMQGLYLCGAGTHPGGGVMGTAGRNAARALTEEGEV